MIRFTLPSRTLNREERIHHVNKQLDDFLSSDAFQEYLNILGLKYINAEATLNALREYDTRSDGQGNIKEAQYAPMNEVLEKRREELFPVFEEMGWISINKPIRKDYSHIIILGGSYTADYNRMVGAKQHISETVKSISALGCYRPIAPKEIDKRVFVSDKETEFGVFYDAMVKVFELDNAPYIDCFVSDRNINKTSNIRKIYGTDGIDYKVFASPTTIDASRASTFDTYKHFFEVVDCKDTDILAVTNNRYVNLQCVQFVYYSLFENPGKADVDFDVVGISNDMHLTTAKDYPVTGYSNDLIGMIDWITKIKRKIELEPSMIL